MSTLSIRRDFLHTDFQETRALLTWNAMVEPGDRVAGEMISSLGARGALDAFLNRVDCVADAESAYERWAPRYKPELAEERIRLAKKNDLKLILPSDEHWPAGLKDLDIHAPLLLWYRGNVSVFESFERSIGVIGSRNASHYGQRVTADLSAVLVNESSAVVSGGALGIDSVAHRATLGLNGKTVAFMAGSLDNQYPAANFALFDQIANQGLMLSEMSPGSNPTRWRFLQRNRLIAAATGALVVTEAGLRSGSINTVNHAAQLDRPVFAVPGSISSPSSAGCNRLIRDQLATALVDLDDLPTELNWRANRIDLSHGLGQLELRAFDVLTGSYQHLDKLLESSGLNVSELRIALGGLKLAGLAKCGENQTWAKQNPI